MPLKMIKRLSNASPSESHSVPTLKSHHVTRLHCRNTALQEYWPRVQRHTCKALCGSMEQQIFINVNNIPEQENNYIQTGKHSATGEMGQNSGYTHGRKGYIAGNGKWNHTTDIIWNNLLSFSSLPFTFFSLLHMHASAWWSIMAACSGKTDTTYPALILGE